MCSPSCVRCYGNDYNLCQFTVCVQTLSLQLTVLQTAQAKNRRQLLHLRASRLITRGGQGLKKFSVVLFPLPFAAFLGACWGCGCSGAQAVSCVALEPYACQYCAVMLLLVGADGVNLQVSFIF